ncbi:hypothetical protein [Conchiformibius kuhniae]|uniref:Uncharacterized protein n=1 Tax=Conchiformibius kuhniae TaxID=211502 RepID=A0A8T9MUI7_9NEIS|nr:hypothetical protein [Conchiformibius kuhniae]UOP04166.1 hypothetical protein LVJ77_06845 [Conchiformibius kuhniae]
MLNDIQFFQQANLMQLLVVYANAKPTNGGFVVVSNYRSSKYATIQLASNIYSQNNQLLSNYFGLPFMLNDNNHELFIQSSFTTFNFFEKIYRQIDNLKNTISADNFLNILLICFFGLRGSIDIKGSYYTTDLLDSVIVHNPDYISRLQTWLAAINININDRHQQPQYIQGVSLRNTQFRVPLRFIFNQIGSEIQYINLYKYNILISNQTKF